MNRRRNFLRTAAAFGVLQALGPTRVRAATSDTRPAVPPRPEPLAPDRVRAFVVAAHTDLAKVQMLLAQDVHLINATWDWGGGDFETALGGAAHMGRRDIAEYLLAQGARPDIFVLTMLGHLEAVQAILTARPETIDCLGPHGISLIAHAQQGGKPAEGVLGYLRRLTLAA